MRISDDAPSRTLRMARVVKTHPAGQALDVIFLDDGSYGGSVKALSHSASSTSGLVDMAPPTPNTASEDDAWSSEQTNPDGDGDGMDMTAVVAMVGNIPVCLGYVFPPVNHLAMKEGNYTKIDRHHSDFATVTESNGNHTLIHPGQAAIHVGNGQAINLEGADHDGVYKINKNKELKAQIYLSVSEAVIRLNNGIIDISARTTINITCDGDVVVRGKKIYLN